MMQVHVALMSEAEGYGIMAVEDLKAGELILQVPLSICVHIESLHLSVLHDIVKAEPHLMAFDSKDELLALLLMAERRAGSQSFWWPYLSLMPREYDTPLYWEEEERKYLAGTNVGLLTSMMEQRILRDWHEIHAKLVLKYPSVLGGLTVEDYRWALSTIWSRAVGVERGDSHSYLRCLAPALDMCNHSPAAASCLEDLIKYDAQMDALRLQQISPVSRGQECYLFYGPYSNAKLLYSYGFMAAQNPFRGVDFWVKVPSDFPLAEWKQEQLLAHDLTKEQPYDFRGTLLGNGVSVALMATIRLIHLAPEEFEDVEKVFHGEVVSLRNEEASLRGLVRLLQEKVQTFTPVEEDLGALAKLERVMTSTPIFGDEDAQIRRLGVPREKQAQEAECSADEEDRIRFERRKATLRRNFIRRAYAYKVVVEDKLIFQETLACLSHRLQELVSGGS